MKVKYKKIGQNQAWGIWHPSKNLIELDERLKGKKLLGTQLHEALHIAFPDLTEERILEAEKSMLEVMWAALKAKEKYDKERQANTSGG